MSLQEKVEVKDVIKASYPNSRTYISNFDMNHCILEQNNRLQVQKAPENQPKISQPLINNYFVTTTPNQMIKITEIRFEDRVVRIVDSFTCQLSQKNTPEVLKFISSEQVSQQSQERSPSAKLPKHLMNLNRRDFSKVRDIKNVVKNVFKILLIWVDECAPPELREELGNGLISILAENKNKYNNNLIVKMFNDQKVRDSFMVFSENAGEELIRNSRIKDKKTHIQVLKKYRKICMRSAIKLSEEIAEESIERPDDAKIEEDQERVQGEE